MENESFYDFGGPEPEPARPSIGRLSTVVANPTATGVEAVIEECAALSRSLDGILALIVATSDGMLIHSTWSEVEGMRAAAISAAALGLGQRIASDFGQGEFHDSVVSTGDRVIGIYAVGDRHVLGVVAAAEDVTLGLLHLSARRTAQAIGRVLSDS
ncbi:MAG: roadblock/LC7 domain-containing protein [Acidimicrobiia bacterium]|nr:roadblock/LC7 domain-containing protein [Acidimicrobiia bacterium]MDH4309566.1 roadblock/LC7 domain-containing protein [Acidimicrobiia bacterium]MDH5295188.1 roadblock/LC7 domain-containing protein [Acidimicrobiia bacterium]